MSVEQEFDAVMRNRYLVEIPKVTGHRPTRMIEMIESHGAVEAVRRLIKQYETAPSEGYTRLWECGRLDLSFEALMHDPRFAALFSAEEREWACKRLSDFRYAPPGGCI